MLLWAAALSSVSARLHFVSLGGWGRGNHEQKVVAETLRQEIRTNPLSFVLSPGSNFMNGVGHPDYRLGTLAHSALGQVHRGGGLGPVKQR